MIGPQTMNNLYRMAAASPLREICGIITKDLQIIPVINVAPAGHQFVMQKSGYCRVLNKLKASGQEILAIYHSHPNGNPEPSQADIDSAERVGLHYLIITPQRNHRWVGVKNATSNT